MKPRPFQNIYFKIINGHIYSVLRLMAICCLRSWFVFIAIPFGAAAQTGTMQIDEWAEKLGEETDVDNEDFRALDYGLDTKDSATFFNTLTELQKKGPAGNHYFNAKLLCLKARAEKKFYFGKAKSQVKQHCTQALNEAYVTSDNSLISLVSWIYGELMYPYEEIELAVTYCLKAMELNNGLLSNEQLSYNSALLGEMLFRTRDYEKSIYYTLKALKAWTDTSSSSGYYKMKCWNTIGQDYQELGKLDSALICYNRSMQMAKAAKRLPYNIPLEVWQGINSGNIGQVLFLQKRYKAAKPLFEYDYGINKAYDYNIAANSLQWLAKTQLMEGKKDSALLQIRESLRLLHLPTIYLFQNKIYLQKAYSTAADIHRAFGNTDSFYHYFGLYTALHDSLERVALRSSIEIAQLRIENQEAYQSVQILQKEKQTVELKRNFIVVAIFMLSVIAVLALNRQRQKLRFAQLLAQQEKAAAEAEVVAAKEQLSMFTQDVIDKAALIEKLEQEVKTKALNVEQQQAAAELTGQTILTEEQWAKFKKLFERLYPGFFRNLKEKVPDITLAEQRMAAITRLHLETKEMATMLGVSVDSVHKTRQRLRRRLRLDAEANLEDFLTRL